MGREAFHLGLKLADGTEIVEISLADSLHRRRERGRGHGGRFRSGGVRGAFIFGTQRNVNLGQDRIGGKTYMGVHHRKTKYQESVKNQLTWEQRGSSCICGYRS